MIQRALAADRLAGALLFAGPDGVGRELLAHRLAMILLCDARVERCGDGIDGLANWGGPVADACGECENCRACVNRAHPDLHVVDRELVKQHPDPEIRKRRGSVFSVEVVRAFVIDVAGTKPVMGRAKVFVLRDIHLMNDAAQNALLKTLEEPPARTYLVLITSAPGSLLPTIRSRCQIVSFDPLPAEFVAERLAAMNPSMTEDQARLCADYAGGSMGLAQRYIDDELLQHDAAMAELLGSLPTGDITATAKRMIASAKKLGERVQLDDEDATDTEAQRRGLTSLLGLLAMRIRRSMRASVDGGDGHLAASGLRSSMTGSLRLTPRAAGDAVRALASAEWQLQRNVNVQLCIESLLIGLGRLIAAS